MALDMDRRQFLGNFSITIGGTTLAGLLPASLLQAATPAACLVNASAWPDPCGDWQLDDICNAYPPYAMHLRPAVAAAALLLEAEPVDRHWVS